MNALRPYLDKHVEVEISGNNLLAGKLIDLGLDLAVLYQEGRFYYIPLLHVQKLKEMAQPSEEMVTGPVPEVPIDSESRLSFRKILNNAKGRFVEIYISGNKSIHGYLTSIMNDYFVFYSPVYKAMFISMNHLKWLIPYPRDLTPYTLSSQALPVNPVHIPLSRTFEEQCQRLQGSLVAFDLADDPNKIGLLQGADHPFVELVNATGHKIGWNLHHLKTVHLP